MVVNQGGDVPIDEPAQCYKPAEEVISAVVEAGLAKIHATLWPLASIKGDDGAPKAIAREREAERREADRARRDARTAKRRR